jgi:hypothetical protein
MGHPSTLLFVQTLRLMQNFLSSNPFLSDFISSFLHKMVQVGGSGVISEPPIICKVVFHGLNFFHNEYLVFFFFDMSVQEGGERFELMTSASLSVVQAN